MTVLSPCRRCHRRADCAIKRAALAALKGTKITKANLLCKIPEQDFPVGTAVQVKAFDLRDLGDEVEQYDKTAITVRGIVSRWRNGKATVALDKDQEITQPNNGPIGILKVEPDRLSLVEGASASEMCNCGLVTKARCAARDFPSLREGADFNCYVTMPTTETPGIVYGME